MGKSLEDINSSVPYTLKESANLSIILKRSFLCSIYKMGLLLMVWELLWRTISSREMNKREGSFEESLVVLPLQMIENILNWKKCTVY
jgi:hypothetical protein